ncbi:MAG: hypothetical protein FWH40_04500 [Coriobacteriia bacterium]|nr:hypothetical protein [Coriobacteriia bacterium]
MTDSTYTKLLVMIRNLFPVFFLLFDRLVFRTVDAAVAGWLSSLCAVFGMAVILATYKLDKQSHSVWLVAFICLLFVLSLADFILNPGTLAILNP